MRRKNTDNKDNLPVVNETFRKFMLALGCLLLWVSLTVSMSVIGFFIGLLIVYLVFRDEGAPKKSKSRSYRRSS